MELPVKVAKVETLAGAGAAQAPKALLVFQETAAQVLLLQLRVLQ
jgi:hypothetical protein